MPFRSIGHSRRMIMNKHFVSALLAILVTSSAQACLAGGVFVRAGAAGVYTTGEGTLNVANTIGVVGVNDTALLDTRASHVITGEKLSLDTSCDVAGALGVDYERQNGRSVGARGFHIDTGANVPDSNRVWRVNTIYRSIAGRFCPASSGCSDTGIA